jgi:type III secretion system FlhB-like substrate exporter
MSRQTSPQFVLERMRLHGFKYYQVFAQDGKTLIEEQQHPDVDCVEAMNRLESILNNTDGLVTVKISERNRDEKGQGGSIRSFTYQLQLGGSHMGNPAPSADRGIGIHGIAAIQTSLEEKFTAKLEALQREYEHREELRRLNEKITDLETQLNTKNPYVEWGMQQLDKYGPAILGGFLGKPAAPMIHGPGQEPVADDIDARAERALIRLLKVDPDFISNLEKLADMAETNQPLYQMAVAMLNQPKDNG